MIILGMTGPIGHGKTTFANALAELEPQTVRLESSLIIAEVANALHAVLRTPLDPYDTTQLNQWLHSLPAILREVVNVHCTFEQIELKPDAMAEHPLEYQKLILHVENLRRNFTLAHQTINNDNKEIYRPLLQWLGGYLVAKVDSGIWWNEMVRRVRQAQAEGCQLCIAGGLRYPADATILRTINGIIVKVYRPSHLQNDMLDPTERERESIVPDCMIVSDGEVKDVQRCAKRFLDDIRAGHLRQTYQTSRI